MRFRWTMEQLEEKTDLEIIRGIITERKSTCTNCYSPLYRKLTELYGKVDKKIKQGRKNI